MDLTDFVEIQYPSTYLDQRQKKILTSQHFQIQHPVVSEKRIRKRFRGSSAVT